MNGFPDDYLSVADLDPDQTLALIDLADEFKRERDRRVAAGASPVRDDLAGRSVALLFEKPSTRTRVSFEVGVAELGGHPLVLSSAELQLGRGETIADTGAVLSRYVHGIVVRTFGQDRLTELAHAASVPVVNALTDREHPCQALADLQTFRAVHGGYDGRILTYLGDGNNVAHSLLLAGAQVGLTVRIAHPEGYAPDMSVVGRARQLAAAAGGSVTVTNDPEVAVAGAHAVYADVWTSMGQESEASNRIGVFTPYRVTESLFAMADPDAVFLHCLPAHRGEEVDAAVIDGPRSRVFAQAENRLHVQKALLSRLIGRH